MTFEGFPEAALDFYDDLEVDNTKAFWEEHREVHATAVKAPMTALTAALADEFGEAKIYRPYRDVRFSKDKTPLKTHQGALVATGPALGYYVQVGAPGVSVGVGFYHAEPGRLAAFRDAIVHDRHGPELEHLVSDLESAGWERGGERLKTSPRGYDADHPRIDLLRHKSLSLTRSYGFEPFIHTPELLDRVRGDWRAGTPLLDWLAVHTHQS
ncbi:DUF2461 domain-containing protein [Aeromicrobium sp. CF3.5]|uniref:DUF2461 domain-containing protein n=1 Tax=Aeromicrobium sp. CF3.5 TaxID=3373078 RepID=UPI003EE6F3D3